jgi:D-alanyl-D-alanine carboxypeptidase
VQIARRIFVIVALLLCGDLSGGGFLAVPALAASHAQPAPAATAPKPKTKPVKPAKPAKPAPKAAPVATAPAPVVNTPALLVDMQTGNVLYENNAGAPWHPASLTKLMTAYIAFQAVADGRLTLDSTVTMSVKAVSQAPAVSGLPAGDTLLLKDALYIMLVKSANDMAWAVAETVGNGDIDAGIAEMNATAAKLGLTRTHYDNPNGLPDDGQVTTARDLAVLAIDLRRTFPQYDAIFRTHVVMLGKTYLRTNNELLTRFAGTTGMKTGYICASGLNVVATVERNGRQLLAVVLGGSSARERDQIAAQMLLNGFSGQLQDSGKSVVNIVDDVTSPPMDMKPLLCGGKAKAYVTARLKQYPMGLAGQPNYLTDKLVGAVYQASDLGVPGGKGPVAAVPVSGDPAEGDAGDADPEGPPVPTPAAPSPAPAPQP